MAHRERRVHEVPEHRVGAHQALEAPLAAQHVAEQFGVAASPLVADVREARHRAARRGLLHRDLERTQVQLAHRLLVEEHVDAGACIRLLVVDHEVLDEDDHVALLGARRHARRDPTRQERILRVVLEVAAALSRAVQVHARRVPAVHAVRVGLLADRVAHLAGKVLVPGRRDDGLRRVGRGGQLAEQEVDPRRAIEKHRGRHTEALHVLRLVCAALEHVHQLLERELVEELLPARVVVGGVPQIGERDAVVRPEGGQVALGLRGTLLHRREQHVGGGQIGVGAVGIGARPVGARQVRQVAVGVAEPVLQLGARHLVGVVDDVRGDSVRQHRLDVVHIVADLDCVVARLKHVGLAISHVIGGHVADGERDGQRLGLAGCQVGGLGEAGKLDRGLLDAALGVGGGEVHLHDVLARGVTGVGDLDGDAHLVARDGGGAGLPVEVRVAHAVPERELDGGLVARLVVQVARLVVAVADVDALLVVDQRPALDVVVLVVAEVLGGGGAGDVVGVGVGEVSGRVDVARDHLAERDGAHRAGRADPQRRHDLRVLLEEAEFHHVPAVDHDDHLVEGAGDPVEQRLGVGGQPQLVGGEVGGLDAIVADDDKGDVGVLLSLGEGRVGQVGRLGLVRLGGAEHAQQDGQQARVALLVGVGALLDHEVIQRLVVRDASVGQALVEVLGAGLVGTARAAAAVAQPERREAEHVDALVAQRERPVVAEQDDALVGDLLCHDRGVLAGGLARRGRRVDGGVEEAREVADVGRHEGGDQRDHQQGRDPAGRAARPVPHLAVHPVVALGELPLLAGHGLHVGLALLCRRLRRGLVGGLGGGAFLGGHRGEVRGALLAARLLGRHLGDDPGLCLLSGFHVLPQLWSVRRRSRLAAMRRRSPFTGWPLIAASRASSIGGFTRPPDIRETLRNGRSRTKWV